MYSGIERLLSISKNLEILDIRDVLYIVVFWEEDEDTPEFVNQIKTQYSNVDIKCIGRKINVQYGEDTANLKAKEFFDTNREHLDRMEKEIRKSRKKIKTKNLRLCMIKWKMLLRNLISFQVSLICIGGYGWRSGN